MYELNHSLAQYKIQWKVFKAVTCINQEKNLAMLGTSLMEKGPYSPYTVPCQSKILAPAKMSAETITVQLLERNLGRKRRLFLEE